MTSIDRFRRWLVVVPLTLFGVLVWVVTSRLIEAEKPLRTSLFAALRLMHLAERVCEICWVEMFKVP